MAGRNARVTRKALVRLTLSMSAKAAGVVSVSPPGTKRPALLTSTSTVPKRAWASRASASTACCVRHVARERLRLGCALRALAGDICEARFVSGDERERCRLAVLGGERARDGGAQALARAGDENVHEEASSQ